MCENSLQRHQKIKRGQKEKKKQKEHTCSQEIQISNGQPFF
jgi:hypothetical protein